MKTLRTKLPVAARVLYGLAFLVFGLNGFLHFAPTPAPPGPPADFLHALGATGYMMPLLAGTQLVAGALLVAGRFVPLALTLLAPVVVNIAAFHLVLDPELGLTAGLLGLEGYLAWAHRGAFAPLLRARATPGAGETA